MSLRRIELRWGGLHSFLPTTQATSNGHYIYILFIIYLLNPISLSHLDFDGQCFTLFHLLLLNLSEIWVHIDKQVCINNILKTLKFKIRRLIVFGKTQNSYCNIIILSRDSVLATKKTKLWFIVLYR